MDFGQRACFPVGGGFDLLDGKAEQPTQTPPENEASKPSGLPQPSGVSQASLLNGGSYSNGDTLHELIGGTDTFKALRNNLVSSVSLLNSAMLSDKASDLQPLLQGISFAVSAVATCFNHKCNMQHIRGPSPVLAIAISFQVLEAIQSLLAVSEEHTKFSNPAGFGLTGEDLQSISCIICLRQLQILRSAVDATRRRSMIIHKDKSPCLMNESGQILDRNMEQCGTRNKIENGSRVVSRAELSIDKLEFYITTFFLRFML